MWTVEENHACRGGDEIHIDPLEFQGQVVFTRWSTWEVVVVGVRPAFRMLSIGRRVSRQASHRWRGPASSETKRVQV